MVLFFLISTVGLHDILLTAMVDRYAWLHYFYTPEASVDERECPSQTDG